MPTLRRWGTASFRQNQALSAARCCCRCLRSRAATRACRRARRWRCSWRCWCCCWHGWRWPATAAANANSAPTSANRRNARSSGGCRCGPRTRCSGSTTCAAANWRSPASPRTATTAWPCMPASSAARNFTTTTARACCASCVTTCAGKRRCSCRNTGCWARTDAGNGCECAAARSPTPPMAGPRASPAPRAISIRCARWRTSARSPPR